MRLVIFAPGLRQSAIGRVVLLVTRELRLLGHEVTVVRTEIERYLGEEPHPFDGEVVAWNSGAPVEQAIASADALLYHVGDNHDFHAGAVEWLAAAPGIVVLHDFFLGHLFWAWGAHQRDRAAEILAAWYEPAIADRFFKYPDNAAFIAGTHRESPLTEWIAAMATGVLTHSNWGCARVLRACSGPVRVVPLAYAPPAAAAAARPEARRDGTFRILTVGHVNPNKRAESVISAIAAHPQLRQGVAYRIVGSATPETVAVLSQRAEQAGVRLTLAGTVSDDALAAAMTEADAVVCLRWPSLEGASASAIEAMLSGKPVLVTDTGFYAELPDDCVLKVDPDNEVEGIAAALLGLVRDRDGARALGARARAWAGATFSPDAYARETIAMVEACAAARPVQAAIAHLGGVAGAWSSGPLTPAIVDALAAPQRLFTGGCGAR